LREAVDPRRRESQRCIRDVRAKVEEKDIHAAASGVKQLTTMILAYA
jgi:hypothetical protein